MNRRIEILEENTVTRRVTRILETDVDLDDPPDICDLCSAPTLWDAEGTARVCVDCGDTREAIEHKPRLMLAGRRA